MDSEKFLKEVVTGLRQQLKILCNGEYEKTFCKALQCFRTSNIWKRSLETVNKEIGKVKPEELVDLLVDVQDLANKFAHIFCTPKMNTLTIEKEDLNMFDVRRKTEWTSSGFRSQIVSTHLPHGWTKEITEGNVVYKHNDGREESVRPRDCPVITKPSTPVSINHKEVFAFANDNLRAFKMIAEEISNPYKECKDVPNVPEEEMKKRKELKKFDRAMMKLVDKYAMNASKLTDLFGWTARNSSKRL
jgi:hypothetical protein